MNKKGTTSILLYGIAISGILVWIFALDTFLSDSLAQVNNTTGGGVTPTNDTQMPAAAVQTPDIDTAIKSVIEQAKGTNATSFAIGNILNQTGLNTSEAVGKDNITMKSVIEQAKGTNATSFAADNIINQTGLRNNASSTTT